MLSTSFLATIKKICHKSPKDRTPEDIEALHELTKHNKVFSSLTEIYGNSFHKPCCKHLKYEFYDSLSWVFEYGSIGDKFYIILSGTVGVEIPKTSKEEEFEEVVQLADGDCFGELALEGNKPRQASIKCKTPCHFIYLHKKDYKSFIGSYIKERRNHIVDFLSTLPIFQGFTKGTITKITYALKEKKLRKQQIVYNEGEKGNELYFLYSGEIGFYKKFRTNPDKNKAYFAKKTFEINIANIGKGEIFGEEELL